MARPAKTAVLAAAITTLVASPALCPLAVWYALAGVEGLWLVALVPLSAGAFGFWFPHLQHLGESRPATEDPVPSKLSYVVAGASIYFVLGNFVPLLVPHWVQLVPKSRQLEVVLICAGLFGLLGMFPGDLAGRFAHRTDSGLLPISVRRLLPIAWLPFSLVMAILVFAMITADERRRDDISLVEMIGAVVGSGSGLAAVFHIVSRDRRNAALRRLIENDTHSSAEEPP